MPQVRPPLRSLGPTVQVAALALPAAVGAEQVLLPAGTFNAPAGAMLGSGPWHLEDAAGAALAARLTKRAADISVDYEHQTLRAAANGQPAPAAGWIRPAEILWRAGVGLVASAVHWTERAAAHIAAGEYRYLSPVFTYRADGSVSELLHVALTNTPALDVLPEVALAAASLLPLPETPMDDLRERVLYLLNLPLTTTDEELLAELDKLKALLSPTQMSGDAGLSAAAASMSAFLTNAQEQVAALTAKLEAAPPADLIAALQGQVAALTAQDQARRKQEVLTAALSDGRLIKDSPLHAHALSLELPALEALTASLTPIAALSGNQTRGRSPETEAGPAEGGVFTAALAAEFGSEESYRAYCRANSAGLIKIYKGEPA